MAGRILTLFFIVSIVSPLKVSWGESYDFRNTRWGMSEEEVIASETIKPIEHNAEMVKYKTQILGKNVELLYLFAQNKLIGSSYKLDENYLNSDHFRRTYFEFKKALKEKLTLTYSN